MKLNVGLPCETLVCHHQFSGALPCARRVPPRTPNVTDEITLIKPSSFTWAVHESNILFFLSS